MLLDLDTLHTNTTTVESIEKAATRLLVQALFNYRDEAQTIFANETDNAADIGEDVTQEALSEMGVSKIHRRLYGKVDLKRACYLFLPEFAVPVALFIDTKAEQSGATARVQMSQLSMTVMQMRGGGPVTVAGLLPPILQLGDQKFLTLTLFAKFIYSDLANGKKALHHIKVACLPNGLLQNIYNPTHDDTIFVVGPNSPERNEEFRTRLSFSKLAQKAAWRVQTIGMSPSAFQWQGDDLLLVSSAASSSL